jgi:2'-5' RNA ligase
MLIGADQFALAICLTGKAGDQVKTLKLKFGKRIGWYHSIHAQAHITICSFSAYPSDLPRISTLFKRRCSSLYPLHVNLDRTGTFTHRDSYTLYAGLQEESHKEVRALMQRVRTKLPFPVRDTSSHPHVSIGRGLTGPQLALAHDLFSPELIDIRYLCDHLTLRKFNPLVNQYETMSRFCLPDSGTPSPHQYLLDF